MATAMNRWIFARAFFGHIQLVISKKIDLHLVSANSLITLKDGLG